MQEKELKIRKEDVETLFESPYVRVYDLKYAPGKHYFNASRRRKEDLAAIKSEAEFQKMTPDAVTCAVILREKGEPDRLLLSYEYRYPAGRYLLSPPAGLLDPEDGNGEEAAIRAAVREIHEETGIRIKESDRVFTMAPLLLCSPGMTDESNAFVCAVVDLETEEELTQEGGVGTEMFRGFLLADKAQAETIMKTGRDPYGNFYSLSTFAVLQFFVSGAWEQ